MPASFSANLSVQKIVELSPDKLFTFTYQWQRTSLYSWPQVAVTLVNIGWLFVYIWPEAGSALMMTYADTMALCNLSPDECKRLPLHLRKSPAQQLTAWHYASNHCNFINESNIVIIVQNLRTKPLNCTYDWEATKCSLFLFLIWSIFQLSVLSW